MALMPVTVLVKFILIAGSAQKDSNDSGLHAQGTIDTVNNKQASLDVGWTLMCDLINYLTISLTVCWKVMEMIATRVECMDGIACNNLD